MNLIKIFPMLIIMFIIAVGCSTENEVSTNDSPTDDLRIKVYTSIYPIQYAVEQIGGDSILVETVYPPGSNDHTYEPTSKEITEIAESDAFIYLGAGLEGFAETLSDALKNQDVELIEIGKFKDLFIDSDEKHEDEEGHENENSDVDPHIWLDPLRMIKISEIVRDNLVALKPDEENTYNTNFEMLESDLLELDQRFIDVLEEKENKNILVSHAAFGYWEERYGIEQLSVNGISSSQEPSQKEIVGIVEQAEEYNIDYIIYEQNVSNRVTKIIEEYIGAEPLSIHNLSILTEEDISNNEDYFSLMKDNLEVLDRATN